MKAFRMDDILTMKLDDYNITKLCVSIAPGRLDRCLHSDLQAIKSNNIHVIICLLEWSELVNINISNYPTEAQKMGFYFYHLPVKDHHTPNLEDASNLVDTIIYHLSVGHNVLIHCKGGQGRAGTISACCLCKLGYYPDDAVKTVRTLRRRAIKRDHQVNFVRGYHYKKCSVQH